VALRQKDKYDKGDLVLIDDNKGYRELAIIISPKIPMYHRSYEFYQVCSICEGEVYIVPCCLVVGEYSDEKK